MAASYTDQLAKLRQDYGQRVADYPATADNIRSEIYGGDKVLPTLRSTRDDAIMSLYDVDKRLASRYANPESETFIRDPYKREQLAAGQHQSVLGSVAGVDRQVQAREDILGENLSKALDLLKLNLESKATEYNMLLNEAKLAQSGGGGGSLAALNALLSGQGGQATPARQSTNQDLFRARVLGGESTAPVAEPAGQPTLGDRFRNLGAGILNIVPGLMGGSTLPTGATPRSLDIPSTVPQGNVEEALQTILTNPPGTSSSDFVTPELENIGIDLNSLQTLAEYNPKLANDLAEDFLTSQVLPGGEEGLTSPANREILNAIVDKAVKFDSGVDDAGNPIDPSYTAVNLYQDLVRLYPEMDAEDIEKLLANLEIL